MSGIANRVFLIFTYYGYTAAPGDSFSIRAPAEPPSVAWPAAFDLPRCGAVDDAGSHRSFASLKPSVFALGQSR